MTMTLRHLLTASLLAGSFAAQAATVVYSDNFDANALGLNVVPAGWSVSDGTVDIIGNPGFFDFIPGSGRYIDLDGSTGNAGILAQTFALVGGTQYTASFDLAGNHRNSATEAVTANFGSSGGVYSLAQNVGWTAHSLLFTPAASGSFVLSFEGRGGDNIGMLLDNVRIAAVPEPQTYALLALGLAAVGVAARRRRTPR